MIFDFNSFLNLSRRELELFGIGCSILEPGAFRTNLLNPEQMTQRVNTIWKGLSPELKNEYGEEYKDRCKWK